MLDEWNKGIAPSAEVRKWFDHKANRFTEFIKKYTEELLLNEKELGRMKIIAKTKR
jgi:uncharacterized protein YeaO (DUF488 family)